MQKTLTLLIGSLFAASAQSAVVIETTTSNQQGSQKQKVIIDSTHARIEASPDLQQFMLISFADKKSYMINMKQKQAIDMTPPSAPPADFLKHLQQQPPQNVPEAKVELVKKGNGPEIAGYPTTHYQIIANDTVCSNEFLAEKALQHPQIKVFADYMQSMKAERKKVMGDFIPKAADPCMQAAEKLSEQVMKLGLSMRSTDQENNVRQEVLSLKTEEKVEENTFKLPDGFEIMTPQQMLQRAMQQGMQGSMQPNQSMDSMQMSPEQRQKMQQEFIQRLEEARKNNPPPQK
ncbi:MAG: hypothetical protein RIT27_22 [Pseudomonadota bacterium]|jgi:hypothetical protein